MEKADISNFFRVIIIILGIYYGLKIIKKYLLPFILKRFIQKLQAKAEQKFGAKDTDIKQGDTVIDKKTSPKSSTNIGGEYIDFEEIE